jgi:hypothetical protein
MHDIRSRVYFIGQRDYECGVPSRQEPIKEVTYGEIERQRKKGKEKTQKRKKALIRLLGTDK